MNEHQEQQKQHRLWTVSKLKKQSRLQQDATSGLNNAKNTTETTRRNNKEITGYGKQTEAQSNFQKPSPTRVQEHIQENNRNKNTVQSQTKLRTHVCLQKTKTNENIQKTYQEQLREQPNCCHLHSKNEYNTVRQPKQKTTHSTKTNHQKCKTTHTTAKQ